MMDTYSTLQGHAISTVVTSKPLSIGGSEGRLEATARGVQVATHETLPDLGMRPEHCSVVVQGFGNVDSITARLLSEMSCTFVELSDIEGGVYGE